MQTSEIEVTRDQPAASIDEQIPKLPFGERARTFFKAFDTARWMWFGA